LDASNDNNDLEDTFNELFDPSDVSRWLSYSRQGFIEVMILELKQQRVMIEAYAELMYQSPKIQATEIEINGQHISASFCLEAILLGSRKLERLLNTTRAYNEQV
jgi:hypothetical protein